MLNRVRQLKKEAEGRGAAGFTIIEVMIVLAIAGIIMAIVFLAIPALQRNNRNTQRKNDASRLAGLVAEYQANHNGGMPANVVADLGTPTWSIFAAADVSGPTPLGAAAPAAITADQMRLYTDAVCTNSTTPGNGTSNRQFVVYYGAEGSTATQCLAS